MKIDDVKAKIESLDTDYSLALEAMRWECQAVLDALPQGITNSIKAGVPYVEIVYHYARGVRTPEYLNNNVRKAYPFIGKFVDYSKLNRKLRRELESVLGMMLEIQNYQHPNTTPQGEREAQNESQSME